MSSGADEACLIALKDQRDGYSYEYSESHNCNSYAGILNMVRLQTDTHALVRTGFGTLKNGSRVDRRRYVSKCPLSAA
jgi:hypothetical protein